MTAIEFLFSLEQFGMKLGLDSMRALCAALGHPERAFTSVHVAGTNGKGSVTAMVETALRAAGYRTARYTSPHLLRIEERFVIDGHEVETAALEAAAATVRSAAEGLVASGALRAVPTFFECTTAAAFVLFRSAGVQMAVVEVGLGGRLDATNVLTPAVTAIVSIAVDHQAQLGTTLESIAAEKAGIAKPGVPMVVGAVPPDAGRVIEQACAAAGAPLVPADDAATLAHVRELRLALAGSHQIGNAAVAVRILQMLEAAGFAIGASNIDAGLTTVEWPGRLEQFTVSGTRVIVDAAHNPAGAEALAEYLRTSERGGVTLVFGVMRDKSVEPMIRALAPLATRIIVTTAPSPRAMAAEDVAAVAGPLHSDVEVVDDPFLALERAVDRGETVVIAGSIFLIGPLRAQLARGILR